MRRGVAALTLALLAGAAQATVPGEPAPPFSLPGSGGTVSLEAYRGKFVYVDFWASWCAPCKRSFPWMADLQRRYPSLLGNHEASILPADLGERGIYYRVRVGPVASPEEADHLLRQVVSSGQTDARIVVETGS